MCEFFWSGNMRKRYDERSETETTRKKKTDREENGEGLEEALS